MGRLALRMGLAAAGFFVGYYWAVLKWAGQSGLDAEAVIEASWSSAFLLAVVCLALVVAWTPSSYSKGRKAGWLGSMTPAAFFGPFAVGTVGIRAALWLIA